MFFLRCFIFFSILLCFVSCAHTEKKPQHKVIHRQVKIKTKPKKKENKLTEEELKALEEADLWVPEDKSSH